MLSKESPNNPSFIQTPELSATGRFWVPKYGRYILRRYTLLRKCSLCNLCMRKREIVISFVCVCFGQEWRYFYMFGLSNKSAVFKKSNYKTALLNMFVQSLVEQISCFLNWIVHKHVIDHYLLYYMCKLIPSQENYTKSKWN